MGVWWVVVAMSLVAAAAQADRGGSSLRGALEALQRRQRSRVHPPMLPQPDYDALYEFVPPQGYPEPDYSVDVEDIADEPKYVVKLLDDNDRPPEAYEYKLIKKKNSHFNVPATSNQDSAFRERAHHSNNDALRDLFMDKSEAEDKKGPAVSEKDAEYALLLGQLWSKYKYSKEQANDIESAPQGVVKLYKEKVVKKRYPDSWGPIAFKRKRSSDSDADRSILPDYEERKSEGGKIDPNYNTYEINDDDKNDLREEYALAFQPLDDDTFTDLSEDNQYTFDNVEKRFPVTKRSSAPYDFGTKIRFPTQNKRETMKKYISSSSGTDPRIIKDLSKIFGDSEIEIIKNPVKRSSDHEAEADSHSEVKPPMLTMSDHSNQTQEKNHTVTVKEDDSHEHHGHHPGISGKEEELDHEHNHNHGREDKPNHQSVSDHKYGEKSSEQPIVVRKKSIDWSDYFGIDKRRASGNSQDRLRKQYFDTFNKEVIYPLNSFRVHSNVKRNFIKPKPRDIQPLTQAETRTSRDEKRDVVDDNNSKLDNIDKKLKNMEGYIVDEALHFSNIGEELDSKEEQEMKEKLLSRLAAAYSLEKMRKALKEFKQTLHTPKSADSEDVSPVFTDEVKAKRVAVKKELLNNEIPMSNNIEKSDDFEDEQGAGHYLNGKVEEQFSEGYMGGSGRHRIPVVSTASAAGACPVLAKIVQRCRGVDLLAGDRGQLFLPLCSLHQICYLCGEAPPTTCDLVFLSEADTTCEGDMSCQRAARSALMALRELHDNLADELDGECEASPCLPDTLKLNAGWQRALQR